MRLFDTKKAAPCIVFGERDTECIETCSDDRIVQEYPYSDTPKMGPTARDIGLLVLKTKAAEE